MPIDDTDLGNLPDQITPSDGDTNDPTTYILSRFQAWTGSVWQRLRVGSQTAANSLSVALASDQATASAPLRVDPTGSTTQPVSAASLPLPAGAATAALQGTTFDADTGAGTQNVAGVSLRKSASGGSVELGTSSDPVRVDPTGTTTQPVSATSLPLPTGAATSANQTTANSSLSSIDGKIAATAAPGDSDSNSSITQVTSRLQVWSGSVWKRLALGQAVAASSVPVVLASDLPAVIKFDQRYLGPFGDLISEGKTPILELTFTYGIFTQTGSTSASGTGASVDTLNTRLRIQSGTGAAGTATFSSVKPACYRPGQGVDARFTAVFTTGVANSTQIAGMGTTTNGYFFGYNGTAFGVLHRNNGSDTWIAQTAWNVDKCDGTGTSGFTLVPTFGNVYFIRYPFLGYGNIYFYVEGPDGPIVVHVVRYANTSTAVQVSNPCLNFFARALNTGNTTNLTIFVGSVGIFTIGTRVFTGPQFAFDATRTTVTTEVAIFSVRGATTLNGVANMGLARLRLASIATDNGNGICTARVKIGATLGGSPSFAAYNGTTADQGVTITSGQSMLSFDTAGTTVTGGIPIANLVLARNSNFALDVTPFESFLLAGQTITFSATSTASATIAIAVNGNEDL